MTSTHRERRRHDAAQLRHQKAGFNLSQWALEHAALTRYLMVVLMVLGFASYFQLGQDEDPPFTFRAMVVRTYWPGATAQQVAEQVTDKLERTLQEVPYADKIRSYSKPGESQIIFQIKDNSRPGEVAERLVHGAQEGRRHPRHLARRHPGAVLQRRVRRCLRRDLRAGERRLQLRRAQGLCRRRAPAAAAREGRGQGRAVRRAGREGLHRGLAKAPGAARASTSTRCWRRSARRTRSRAPARSSRRRTWCRCAWAASSPASSSCAPCRSAAARAASCGLATSPRSGAATSIRPRSRCGTRASEVIALGVSMAKGGDIIALGKALRAATAEIDRRLPAGMKLAQVQDQPVAVSKLGQRVRRAC